MSPEHEFINFYTCPECHQNWTDRWTAMCDDDCPHCGARHITPKYSEDADQDVAASLDEVREMLQEAHNVHIYDEGDEHEDDCSYCAALRRADIALGRV